MVEVQGNNYCRGPHTAGIVSVHSWDIAQQTQYPQCAVAHSNYRLAPLPRFKCHSDSVIVIRDDSSVVITVIRNLARDALKDISTNHTAGPYSRLLQLYVQPHHKQHKARDTLAQRVVYNTMTMTTQPRQQTIAPPIHYSVNKHGISDRLEHST